MTVVLAVVCSDGVVIGADSQITESDRGLSFPAQKLHPLGDCAAWGGSGARGVLNDLRPLLQDSATAILEAPDIGGELQERVLPVFKKHYENYIPDVPGEGSGGGVSAYLLAAGFSQGGPWIVEINPNGLIGRYEDVGFHAIGSGAPMAQQAGALLSHFRMTARTVEYGVVGVVRVLEALEQTSPSVGRPFSVACIREEGAHHLDEKEIAKALKDVQRWRDLEQKALDRLFD
ncbi:MULTISPECIES: proteasome protein [unclassified Micromonospora]|uniref:proteasome protein n=1 Tax=unclassified Micromonospora TaxID=2617518 RepID=UPI0003EECCAA|nr:MULTISPECIES: proteasome protein [unclassified Micromonospora]EWM66105.1 LigA protein [Micromonospora sp. M42]MCK1807821.1 proteasome protein [Micromonospora sp. R42106]MCK1832472.1 proteasome protein [Micromonospora sp. R42003]MCK1843794.1 proteasome protein [Micromonospora sp. R42004]MCM1020234.1 proteasome protein [Micromonospora sp. XM-20-01]